MGRIIGAKSYFRCLIVGEVPDGIPPEQIQGVVTGNLSVGAGLLPFVRGISVDSGSQISGDVQRMLADIAKSKLS